jgi:hypothetical protein
VKRPDEEDERRKTANLAAAAVLLALAIAALWLVRFLDERRKLELCLEAARADCVNPAAP